jgi:hypothetical protein
MNFKNLTMCAGVALLALNAGAVLAQAMPHHTAHHTCLDSLHKEKQAFADTRLKVLKSPRAHWEQLAALDSHMADVQRIERTVAAGHPMGKQDCDTLTAQVKGLQGLMTDLHTKGSHAHAPSATPPSAASKTPSAASKK